MGRSRRRTRAAAGGGRSRNAEDFCGRRRGHVENKPAVNEAYRIVQDAAKRARKAEPCHPAGGPAMADVIVLTGVRALLAFTRAMAAFFCSPAWRSISPTSSAAISSASRSHGRRRSCSSSWSAACSPDAARSPGKAGRSAWMLCDDACRTKLRECLRCCRNW